MADSLTLSLILALKDQMSQGLGGIKEKLGGVNLGALALGGAAVGGVVALGKALWSMGQEAAAEEVGIAKLGAVVRASGGDWGEAEGAIESYLAAELKRTALDDGNGREAIARLTTATGDYKTSLDLMGLTQDLATARGISLSAAAEIVGKVHEGNTSILTRYGVTLDEGATAAEALAAMQTTFAGQAEAYGNTQEGAQKKLDIAMGNLRETIGGLVLPIITQLMMVLGDLAMQVMPVVEGAIEGARPVFDAVFGWIRDNVIPIISAIVGYVVDNWPQILATVTDVLNPLWDLVQLIFGEIVGFVTTNQDTIKTIIETAWNYVQTTVESVIKIVQGIIQTVTGLISGDWDTAWNGIQTIFDGVWTQIQNIVTTVTGVVKGILDAFGLDIGGIWSGIETTATTVWNNVKTAIETPINAVKGTIQGVMGEIQGFFDGVRIPHIPTPHINVWTTDGPLGIPIPHVDVQWYQHGLDAIISRPTLIGVGEAGAERVTVTPLGGGGSSDGNQSLINAVRALVVSQSELIQAMGGATRAMSLLRQYDLEASLR